MFWDPRYFLFAIPALLLAFYAQWKVRSAYSRYSKVPNRRGLSGNETARILLRSAGLEGIPVEETAGELTDHYDPSKKIMSLSRGVSQSASVAAMGIVAHETGHAMQDATKYGPLKWRSALVPTVSIGSWLGPIIFMIGLFIAASGRSPTIAWIGLLLFAGTAVFALVTLPVEFNASKRALQMLNSYGLADGQELQQTKQVLDAAALTYVAALAQALSTLLYYVFLLTGFSRRD